MSIGRIAVAILFFCLLPLSGRAAIITAGEVHGYPVHSADGVVVGTAENLLVDLEGGRISYLLVRAGARQVLVPWRAVRVGLQPPAVRLALSAEKFRQAPTGGEVDAVEEEALHRFFGVAPYWQGDPAASPPRPPRNLRIVR